MYNNYFSGENFYLDLSNIPQDSCGRKLWVKSVDCTMNFKYKEFNGTFTIKNTYEKQYKSGSNRVLDIEYNNKIYSIQQRLLNSELIYKQIGLAINYKYQIGDIVNNLQIIEREHTTKNYGNKMKWYRGKCLQCGFDDNWKTEYALNSDEGCICCAQSNCKTIKGINDIATTNSWMIPYFIDENDAYKYTCCSSKRIYMKCPFCGRKTNKELTIRNLYKNKGIGCVCLDGISYPNKFIYAFVKQLGVDNIICEFNPEWLGKKRFDIYFEYKNLKYIIEMDGGLGHGNNIFGKSGKDIIGLKIDQEKDFLACKNNINVIRIDCIKSDLEYIKNSILHSELNNIFNLQFIDWIKCEEYARDNLVKIISQEYDNDIFITPEFLSKKYNLCYATINAYIKIGRKVGWVKNSKKKKLRVTSSRIKPIMVNNKYYFSCISSLVENANELFNIENADVTYISNKLCKKDKLKYKNIVIEYISKNTFKEKYNEKYQFLYI